MNLGVLFSGGKDSVHACSIAMESNDVSCLISILSENEDSYMFHTPNISHVQVSAEAMQIPLAARKTAGMKEAELDDLRSAIVEAVEEYGIEGIVTGAIDSVYQASRVQRICSDLGLWCFNPVWQVDQAEYLRMLIAAGYEIMITGVYAYPLDESFLGAILDEDKVRRLERLCERYRINPAGEGGELETFVLDCPIFKRRIKVLSATTDFANNRGRFMIEHVRLDEK